MSSAEQVLVKQDVAAAEKAAFVQTHVVSVRPWQPAVVAAWVTQLRTHALVGRAGAAVEVVSWADTLSAAARTKSALVVNFMMTLGYLSS